MKDPVIVSVCLLGINSRYDGTDSENKDLIERLKGRCVIPVCPEQLGGLPTPRPRAEISKGGGGEVLDGNARVIDEYGKDVTGNFKKGATSVLRLARLWGAKKAFLKEKSPSCGVKFISRKGLKTPGSGVTAALLEREGIITEGF